MKLSVFLVGVFVLQTHTSFAMDAVSPRGHVPKEEIKFPGNCGTSFVKEAILFDIQNNLSEILKNDLSKMLEIDLAELELADASPLFVETLRMLSPEVYLFLRAFYAAIKTEDIKQKKDYLECFKLICFREEHGGAGKLNFDKKFYKPLVQAYDGNDEKIWEILADIAKEVLGYFSAADTFKEVQQERVRAEYQALISPRKELKRKKSAFQQLKSKVSKDSKVEVREVRADKPKVEIKADKPKVEIKADKPKVEVKADKPKKEKKKSKSPKPKKNDGAASK